MKLVLASAIAAALALSGLLGLSGGPGAPTSAVPEAPPVVAAGDVAGSVKALQQRLRTTPEDYRGWAALGLAYVDQARVGGDALLYLKAEEAIARSLELRPRGNVAGLGAAAALSGARHEFTTSLRQARRALAVDPYDAVALAVRVDALTELGRYADQMAALREADRRQPGVPVSTRWSYALELRGRLAAAHRVLEQTATSTRGDRAYVETLQANLDRRLGRLAEAGRHVRTALRASPDLLLAQVAQARLAVARDDLPTAVEVWQRIVTRMPLPEYVTELGELYLVLRRPRLAREQFSVVQDTITLLEANGVRSDLETALFQADHGSAAQALARARAEWRRRSSVLVADSLAWALWRNDRPRAALAMSRRATALNTKEARMWQHRGIIEAELGLDDAARRHLRLGLRLDPGASPWQAARARAVLERISR